MTINLTIKSNPETATYRYIGDWPEAGKCPFLAKKPEPVKVPLKAAPAGLPPVLSLARQRPPVDTAPLLDYGALKVNGLRIRWFKNANGLYINYRDFRGLVTGVPDAGYIAGFNHREAIYQKTPVTKCAAIWVSIHNIGDMIKRRPNEMERYNLINDFYSAFQPIMK